MECHFAKMYENKCGMHTNCQTCVVRGQIKKAFETKKRFSNIEVVMQLDKKDKQSPYNITLSGTYLVISKKEYLLITFHDITREKYLERSIEQSTEKFLLVFESLPVGAAICDKDGLIREVNNAYVEYLGFESKAASINTLNIFDNPCINPEFKEMMKQGIPVFDEVKYDYRIINEKYAHSNHTDVKYFRFIVDYLKNPKGEVESFVIIWVDNTLVHNTLKQNAAFERMINLASSVSNIGFCSADLLKKTCMSTPIYLSNLGGITSSSVYDAVSRFENLHPDDRDAMLNYIERAGKEPYPAFDVDVRVKTKDGGYRWIKQYIIQQSFDPANNSIMMLGVNIDIEKTKKEQEDLKIAKERAESSDKLKSAFLANMSHEIRTPLNAIVGFSDLLAVTDNVEEREGYREIIRYNNELLLQLINDILDLSKIEANTLEFNWSDVDVNILFRDLEQTARYKNAANSNVEINFIPGLPQCFIHTERVRLSQVVMNFLTNAMKFTEKGSITFGYELRDDGLYFYVTDTGSGIPEEKQPHIFERFVKLNDFKQGTGLGLAICQSIINKLGGEIGVTSVLGEGSTFWFTLPEKPMKHEIAPKPESIAAGEKGNKDANPLMPAKENKADGPKKKILIAEDIVDNYHLLEILLKNNYELYHAWNGQEAVELYVKHSPDVILMDIRMPEWDGYEATAAIRQLSTETPIVAVTAFAYSDDKTKILASGFNGYLTKPVKSKELFEMLEALGM